jgi:AbrB family looped-hinge helix DNA binding protein
MALTSTEVECHYRSMSDTHTVMVGPKGRIVIPAPLRAEIGVKTGDELVALAEGGGVLLLPGSAVKAWLRGMFRGASTSLADELIRERHEAAQREAAE